ncbi:MAG: enoyl-CoA hydratase/isomerase family protein, partial [Alphaproteobacteria bacterium]
MTRNTISLTRDGAIATLTIDRPEKRNALTNEMLEEIERLARSLAADERTRAVIVTATGNDFSIGADLSQPR